MDQEFKKVQLKDLSIQDSGQVRAVFATLGVVDKQGDIILPGAIQNGQAVRMSAYNHASWGGAKPVGKGTIIEQGNELVFNGQFFLDTIDGADTYKTVKNLGPLGEWSFGFDVLEKAVATDEQSGETLRKLSKLDVFEVSPVLLGAGVNTRTVDIKSDHGTDQSSQRDGAESKPFAEHAKMLRDQAADFVKRSQSIADLRAADGKEPASDKNRESLKAIASELTKAADALSRLAEEQSVERTDEIDAEVAALFEQIEINQAMRGI